MRKKARRLFWTFFTISIIALLLGITIKWMNIHTSPIEGWNINNMFSPFKDGSWSLIEGWKYEWSGSGLDWHIADKFWFDNVTKVAPTTFLFNFFANYLILIVATVAMGLALLSFLIFAFSTKTPKNKKPVAPVEPKEEKNNTTPIQVIFQPHQTESQPVKPVEPIIVQHHEPIVEPKAKVIIPTPIPVVKPVEPKVVKPKPIPTPQPTMEVPKAQDDADAQDFLAMMEAKYAAELKKQEEAEKLERQKYEEALKNAAQDAERQKIVEMLAKRVEDKKKMSTQERAKLDGSAVISEQRSELQKHANKMRSIVPESHKKLKGANLRDMTKKELISFMRSAANEINNKKK
ncbi:cell envelope integrity protein TolA [Williamsoniiplasma lucivorax]|uniref:Uncharacterized protein n=1 Tax=Williamsoniiplasma lucivorax TaxID=209274 RepID=A0A2S5REL9_9MOLU|nr:cell envelope integrity protein TolA [Williamsoniiplasma lucivorax]PPE05761.1 hypothetical protein ELUCI_v1c00490 [Williamsoniiplasma lucivorax]